MKTKNSIWIVLAVLILFAANAQAAVTVSPAVIMVPNNTQSTWTITWTLTRSLAAFDTRGTSIYGWFSGPNNEPSDLGQINTTLIGHFTGGILTTTIQEILVVPQSVLEEAARRGLPRIEYHRRFDGDYTGVGGIGWGITSMRVTSRSAAQLNITNIRLYFENNRAEITVKRKEPGLKTFADINFTGKGLFKGYWQVDDRIISYVNKNLIYGKSLTIATPDMPSLPTFSEGTHVVKFIIQNPVMDIEFPKALYYVTPGETTETIMINILNPFNLAVLERKDPLFQWQASKPLEVYLVEFMEAENGEPVFAAYTIESRYVIPHAALKNYLQSPQPYYWRVTGFDKENNIAGESEIRQVRFKTE